MTKLMLTPHFSLEEFEHSDTALAHNINNKLPASLFPNDVAICKLAEEVRTLLGDKPLKVSSGYRCASLNKRVGGVSSSQHLTAEACDLIPQGSIQAAYEKIRTSDIPYDQLILETAGKAQWLHISYNNAKTREQQRRSALKMEK